MIVGRFIGKDALAAEGAAAPVMNLVILAISGVTIGAGVLMSEFFGAQDGPRLRRELATTLLSGFWFSLAVAVLGFVFTPQILQWQAVPADIFDITVIYLRITFLGAPFTCFYNALAAGLKSVGDAKTPLRFLMFSSLLNILLDLVLIGALDFGIACSAATTVFAQAVSALLAAVYLARRIPDLCPRREEWAIDRPLLGRTLRYGSVTALQQACQPIGKVLIQGQVNALGVDVMAAYNAVTRVDDFAFTPEQSIASGITTFIAQNRGAGQRRRIRRGLAWGLGLESGYWLLICGATLALKKPVMELFVSAAEPDIVALGCAYLTVMAFLYLLPAFTNGMQGFYRGMGRMGITLLGTFIQTSLRVVSVFILCPRIGLPGAAWACGVGWTVMLLFEIPYYFVRYHRSLGADAEADTPVS